MATNLTALQSAIKVVDDVVSDSLAAAKDTTTAAKLAEYENLLPDVLALIPQIGEIPAEASALAPTDVATLLGVAVTDLSGLSADVTTKLNACLKLLSDIATVVVPDLEGVIAAFKASAATAAPAAPASS